MEKFPSSCFEKDAADAGYPFHCFAL